MQVTRSQWMSSPRAAMTFPVPSMYTSARTKANSSKSTFSAGQIELFLFLAELSLNEDREGIIFIDEPELHLDPQWHRLILQSLRRLQPRAQLIVATHSPEIFDAAASYQSPFPRGRGRPTILAVG